VRHAARKLWRLRYERLVLGAPVDDDLVPIHRWVPLAGGAV
jgi:hypothetical protein